LEKHYKSKSVIGDIVGIYDGIGNKNKEDLSILEIKRYAKDDMGNCVVHIRARTGYDDRYFIDHIIPGEFFVLMLKKLTSFIPHKNILDPFMKELVLFCLDEDCGLSEPERLAKIKNIQDQIESYSEYVNRENIKMKTCISGQELEKALKKITDKK